MKAVLHLGLAVASLCVAGAALAGEPLDKPASDRARFGRSIDPNTFIVQAAGPSAGSRGHDISVNRP